ncbi:MAG TPA: DUF1254 domain-containing protein [Candidatus Limnocylindrales bacterium]
MPALSPDLVRRFLARVRRRTVVADVLQGLVIGGVLAFVTGGVLVGVEANAMQTTVDGWSTVRQCGEPGNDILLQAACARDWTAVNIPPEAVYWTTTVDSAGQTLSGQHDYVLHFPPGGLPPNDAFWSLTMTDAQKRLVANPADRYAVGDRSGLVPNADGSVDISIQTASPAGHESNWLPAPAGDFMLWLRVYQPGAAILDGTYTVPPVGEAATDVAAGNAPGVSAGRVPWFRILLALAVLVIVVAYLARRRRRPASTDQRRWRLRHRHLITFGAFAIVAWVMGTVGFIYVYPRLIYNAWENAMVAHGVDAGSSTGIPVNTLYAVPDLASPSSGSAVLTTGANVDTLYTGGWLDLGKEPQVLHVPDMVGRYYSVEFIDPQDGTVFAYVGRRVTGTGTGDFLVTGPGWKGTVPSGATQLPSPNNSVFVAGRVLVENDSDLATAYGLAKQIGLTPLDRWPSGQ